MSSDVAGRARNSVDQVGRKPGSIGGPRSKGLSRARYNIIDPTEFPIPMTSSIEASPAVQETPQVAINDIGSAEDFLAAIDATIKYFDDGDIVEGTIVK